jgi:SAM-dependent methyltransferase
VIDEQVAKPDPRWGNVHRERKAEAILGTVAQFAEIDILKGTWLDIGCGNGGVAATLAGKVGRAIGIDPEPWEVWPQFCNERSNLSFHVGSYGDLTDLLGQDAVDVVVCNQVYEHVDDPVALIASIHRILKPGGLCYFAGPNLLWPIEPHVFWPFVHWLPRRFAQRLMAAMGSKRAHNLDARSWSWWKLNGAFHRSDFSVQGAIRERLRAQADTRASKLLNAFSKVPRPIVSLLSPLSPGFVFILRKPSAGKGTA